MDDLHHSASSRESATPGRAVNTAVAMTALVAGFFLLRELWGHVAGYWPYLLLLACPLMHLFHGHGGHGGHGHDGASGTGANRSPNADT